VTRFGTINPKELPSLRVVEMEGMTNLETSAWTSLPAASRKVTPTASRTPAERQIAGFTTLQTRARES
jgi:hypothetical protein